MQRVFIIAVLAAVLVANLAAARTAGAQASATRAAAGVPPALTSGAQIDAYLTRANFHGFMYLERHGHVILSKGYGMADVENKVPNTAQTTWPAFAETRFLVALALMRLQDKGRLAVRDKLCRYLSGCPAAWQPLTIAELLLNTSGMGSYDPFAPGVRLPQTLAACKATPLLSSPGTASPWSDCNTFLLGTVLERATGTTWATAMQAVVFGPAGMSHSGRMTNALKPPQRGRLYRAGVPTPELNYDGYNLAYTTAEDMIRLNHALLAGTLISQRALRALFTPRLHDDPNDPHSPWRGYEVVMSPATATTYRAVCVSCVNGGGEDDEGDHAGFFMTIAVSPEAGTLQIEINNDTGYFNPGSADNTFASLISTLLYGKARGATAAASGRTPVTQSGRAPVTQLSSGAQIDAYLTQHHFSGYILLERHGHVILSKGYGMADTQAHVPNTIRSRWPDVGTNRFITALAILKLQDEHKLSVRDTLCRYLTGCPSTWRSLTIQELLLDTSGLGTFDTTATPGGVAQALDRCKALPLAAAPGTVTPESRCNNLLLNSIIVTVMGRPWAAAMQTLLFGPAHMTNSGRLTNAVTPPARVQGYSAGAPVLLGNYNDYYSPYSSVEDLARMDRALLSGHLLSRTALHALLTPYRSGVAVLQRYIGSNATDLSSGYECYLRPATRTTVTVVDKPGDVGGFLVDDALSPDDGSIAIMAQNDDSVGTAPTDLFFGLAPKLLWGK